MTSFKHLFIIVFILLIFVASCSEDKNEKPCEGNGTICFTNKTDSAVTIDIAEAHNRFTVGKDIIECVQLEGDKAYTINITGREISWDTVLIIQVCDNRDYIVLK